ncbi:hypothetical protein A0256_18345 [Mucilaginibacter sp. PAMC 26640]|nr:hypothetical protein A0256_18345 [Mucilaginibacter sp. PAMC 26640]
MSDSAASTPKRSYLYFANLDGVRAIAAFMVVCSHIQLHKENSGIYTSQFIDSRNFGKIGVTIFFTLSGFLISYLLLEEKTKFGFIARKNFYIRRILRIWPLYFLLIVIGFFIYPAQGSVTALLLSILLMPNVAFCLKLLPNIFDPIWSIGVEEQFYIFHPHIFRFKKMQHILYMLTAVLLALIILNLVVSHLQYTSSFMLALDQFLYFTRFDDMMIGSVVSLLYFNTKNHVFAFQFQRAFNLLFNKYVHTGLILLLLGFIFLFVRKEIGHGDIVISSLVSLIMVRLCEPSSNTIILGNKVMGYCGKISYGIYLLHKYPLFLMLYLIKTYFSNQSAFFQNTLVYLGTITLVILLATISYYGYERYFLRLKTRFQKITATKSAVNQL